MELRTCPLCGGTNTEIRENTYWTGMRMNISNVTLHHRCEAIKDAYITRTITLRARTTEQAIEVWNA